MSYTELEAGYMELKNETPLFFIGDRSPDLGRRDAQEKRNDSDNEDTPDDDDVKHVVVGICAMEKKSTSKPMREILSRLEEFEYIKTIIFPEKTILHVPVEEWPLCDCLISFHSSGFPLDKARKYSELRKPYIINNLEMQYQIQDRRRVYAILQKEGIMLPRYVVLDRDGVNISENNRLKESEDYIVVNGIEFYKPFVEKPISAEDHNIYIYYPSSAGGGSQRLFRKIGSRSSVYSSESRVRKTGSFIYEDFMPTDGTDVKVYTVGPDYAHAEARKSPALDGKVERDSEGKEVRYPVILSSTEKLIARKVCLAFKQIVCGFDLLRANGKSYVCDVNGFSFVKNSVKYYDDCAKILGNVILRELGPTLNIPWMVPFQLDDPPIVPTTYGKMMELRCVCAVIRHGDRTPKQKLKMEVRHPKFFEIFAKYGGYTAGHVKLKQPQQLQEVLDVARALLADSDLRAADPNIEDKLAKLQQVKNVLEMYGHFSGINRKVQLKYQPKGYELSSDEEGPKEPSLVLIIKWGGELTPAGRVQAEELGRMFRCMYPGGQGEYAGTQGLGLLRLHSTYRHDLKIYASDEGRVQMTAAAFAKGLLALEGELTPILVQMVKSANTNGLLDNDSQAWNHQLQAKTRLHDLLQQDRDFGPDDYQKLNPTNAISIENAISFIQNPVRTCRHIYSLIQSLIGLIVEKRQDAQTRNLVLYHGETWELMHRRWMKLEKDFLTKSGKFDISKVPDIYDCIKYDLQHNQHSLQFPHAEELYVYAKAMADVVIPQEYGLTQQEKVNVGLGICTPLLKKLRADLQRNLELSEEESVNRLNPQYSRGVSSPGRHVRTRLYFTSESHIHSLLTVLRYGGLMDELKDEQWRRAMDYVSAISEVNYMTQLVIMLYEDPTKELSSDQRFHVELHFSPGVNCCVHKNLPPGPGFRPNSFCQSTSEGEHVKTILRKPSCIQEEEDFNDSDSPQDSPTVTEDVEPTTSQAKTVSDPIPIIRENSRTLIPPATQSLRRRNSDVLPDPPQRPRSLEDEKTPTEEVEKFSKESIRRHRHSIAGQLTHYLKLVNAAENQSQSLNTGKLGAPSLFSTAVISGSSSAPDLVSGSCFNNTVPGRRGADSILLPSELKDDVNTCLFCVAIGGCGGVPSIRPLETLHNALSMRQLDDFLGKMCSYPRSSYNSPRLSSIHAKKSLPLDSPSSVCSLGNSGPPSFISSSSGPSTPNNNNNTFGIFRQFSEVDGLDSPLQDHSPGTAPLM